MVHVNDITFLLLSDQAEDRQWAAEPPAHSLGGLARNTHRGVDASASERVSQRASYKLCQKRAHHRPKIHAIWGPGPH